MHRVCFTVLLFSLLTASPPAWAEYDADQDPLSFANALLADGDYYRAVTEYKRYLHTEPTGSRRQEAQLRMGHALLEGGEFNSGLETLDALLQTAPESDEAIQARRWIAGSLYEQERYQAALQLSLSLDLSPPDKTSFIQLCRLRLNDLPPPGTASADWADPFESLPRKSPRLSGMLSAVLPGAGQLYVNRPYDAAWAFLLNSVFIGATVIAFDHDEPVAGGFAAAMTLVWYTGNIYNAVNGAQLYNKDLEEQFFTPMENDLLYGKEAPLLKILFPIAF